MKKIRVEVGGKTLETSAKWAVILVFFAAFLFSPFLQAPVQAQGGLKITPQRLLFEGRSRNTQVTLINSSDQPSTYRILLKNMRMTENGEILNIDAPRPGENFADKMIRYSPREVTIPAGSHQIIRLMVRKPRDLPEGEYRSHMLFKAIPDAKLGKDIEKAVGDDKLSISIIPVFGISIPVIVRHGKTHAQIALSDLALLPPKKSGDPARLSLQIAREGNQSIFADSTVMFQSKGNKELQVGVARGIAHYVPLAKRSLEIKLHPPEGVELKNGVLKVVFRDRPENGAKVLAEASLKIP